ncbi:MAG: hypothetical protein GY871_04200 [Actinomycetales bacterium]|nr:hypothetical protein [Actinomycetales bacterium]
MPLVSMSSWTCYIETPFGGVLIDWTEDGVIGAMRAGVPGVILPASKEKQ